MGSSEVTKTPNTIGMDLVETRTGCADSVRTWDSIMIAQPFARTTPTEGWLCTACQEMRLRLKRLVGFRYNGMNVDLSGGRLD